MDPNQRIDYFRSELEGKLAQVRKDLELRQTVFSAHLIELEKKVETLTRELQHARLGR